MKMSSLDPLPVLPLLVVVLYCPHSGASNRCVVLRMPNPVAAVECRPDYRVYERLVDVYLVSRRLGDLESRRTYSGPI